MAKLNKRKLLNIRYMPKRPKYKKGFTLRHHFDEWWDRRPHGWKVKLFVFLGFSAIAVAVVLLLWAHHQTERDHFVTGAKLLNEKRVHRGGTQVVSEEPGPPPPLITPSASLQVRPGE